MKLEGTELMGNELRSRVKYCGEGVRLIRSARLSIRSRRSWMITVRFLTMYLSTPGKSSRSASTVR